MKKLFFLTLFIACTCFPSTAQFLKITLPREDVKQVLTVIKQDMVYDTLNTPERLAAVASCEKLMKTTKANGAIELPQEYLTKYLERISYNYEEHKRTEREHDRFLRVVNQLYKQDPTLSALKDDYNLERFRKRVLRDIKTSSQASIDAVKIELSDDNLNDDGTLKKN